MRKIYLDHAATTPVDEEVLEAMLPFFNRKFGNPSSLHSFGQEARRAVEDSREKVAKLVNAKPEEIVFTSCATESNNFALKGILKPGDHVITSSIEHHAVLHVCEFLEKSGVEVTYLPVDKHGLISISELERAIKKNTKLISIMHANNEIGTIEPIKDIAKICKKHDILFHTDAVQSAGKIEIDVKKIGIDLLSISSHKLYGPKGIGCLYVREGIKIQPLLHGGGHERGFRSGTENVPGIVGFGKACEIAKKNMKKESDRQTKLRDKLIKAVLDIEDTKLNGHPKQRLPNNAHFSFKGIEGESLIMYLDMRGIAASTGSACSTRSLKPSHVLIAIGLSPIEAQGSLRLTLGRSTTEDDINYTIDVLHETIKNLRRISPI